MSRITKYGLVGTCVAVLIALLSACAGGGVSPTPTMSVAGPSSVTPSPDSSREGGAEGGLVTLRPERVDVGEYIADDGTLCEGNLAIEAPLDSTQSFRRVAVEFASMENGIVIAVVDPDLDVDLLWTDIYAVIVDGDTVFPFSTGTSGASLNDVRAVEIRHQDLAEGVSLDPLTVCVVGM